LPTISTMLRIIAPLQLVLLVVNLTSCCSSAMISLLLL
jgi:hypothetical protein